MVSGVPSGSLDKTDFVLECVERESAGVGRGVRGSRPPKVKDFYLI